MDDHLYRGCARPLAQVARLLLPAEALAQLLPPAEALALMMRPAEALALMMRPEEVTALMMRPEEAAAQLLPLTKEVTVMAWPDELAEPPARLAQQAQQ